MRNKSLRYRSINHRQMAFSKIHKIPKKRNVLTRAFGSQIRSPHYWTLWKSNLVKKERVRDSVWKIV